MENLTKQQLVLVGLLVSFVTSIATGIVTVSLLDQAPKGITQTINRVVERTIERVVTEPSTTQTASPLVTRETVVVKEDERVSEAIEKNEKSIVRVFGTPGIGVPALVAGLGTIVTKDGMIVIDGAVLGTGYTSYFIETSDGKRIDALPIKGIAGRLGFLKTVGKDTFTPAILADSDTLKLGQTVVAISGAIDRSVAEGIISRLVRETADAGVPVNATAPRALIAIDSTAPIDREISGGPLVNLSGEIVALSASGVYVPSNVIGKMLKAAAEAATI